MGVCCSCCRRKTIEEDDDEDDLAATTATAAKDADAKDVKVDIDAAVSSLDAGTVEIVVARLRTVDARAKAFEERDLPLVLTLYYRRMSPHAVEGGRGADGTWVIVDKKECLPNRHEKGAMVVNFRERALRELSRHKAPVFKLPAAFDLNCPMQLVCRDPGGALDSDEDSDDDANGSSFSGGTPSRPTTPAGTSVSRGSTPFKDGVNRPVARRERGGRSAPRTVGELKFTMRDLVQKNNREWKTELTTTDRAGRFGDVGIKTADVTLRLTPVEMTRGWTKQTKPRTPKELLSFETLLEQLKADAKKKLEEQGLAGTNTSWDKEKQEKEAALARGEDGRAHRGLAGAKRTRYNGAQRHGTLTRRENQYAAR